MHDRRSFTTQSLRVNGSETLGFGNGPLQAPFEMSNIEEIKHRASLVDVSKEAGVEDAMIFSLMAGQCSSSSTTSTPCIENLIALTHLTIDSVEGEVISKEPSYALSIDVGGESCLMFSDEWMSSSSSLCAQRRDTVPSGLSPCKGSTYSHEAPGNDENQFTSSASMDSPAYSTCTSSSISFSVAHRR
jgi:hypothetical protein